MLGPIFFKRFLCQNVVAGGNDKIAKTFFDSRIQETLKSLTGLNYSKVFRIAKSGKNIKPPTYVFMTEKQLQEARQEAREKALKLLQMPPVMSARKDNVEIIDEEPAIKGFDAAKYVFTDITYGIHDRDRIIVCREPDGTLRQASGEERDRMNQIYFPKLMRSIKAPPLFEIENLTEILARDKYLYVLDRNCVQFEPDHPTYIRTAHFVYDFIDTHGHYDELHSTRHYGPMVFYFAYEKKIDNLMMHYFKHYNLDDACKLVQLYSWIHPNSKIEAIQNEELETESGKIKHIRSYVAKESRKETKLHMALESMLETMEHNKKTAREMLSKS